MRVLMLHNRYLVQGGEEQATGADVALLRQFGHQVELLEQDNRDVARIGRTRTALSSVWSHDSYRVIAKKLSEQQFDVLHVQNFFPLWSPSVYFAASRSGVAVVQTLHNYRLMCVNAMLFRDAHVCEDCIGKSFPWPGVVHGCYRESRVGSAFVGTMIGLHNLMRTWTTQVDAYIAVTEFARGKYIAGGLPAQKISVRPNFLHPSPSPGRGEGGYALYAGRLSEEKGITTMLAAWQIAENPIKLKIVGDGPLAGHVLEAANARPSIQYLGRKSPAEVLELMRNAEFLVFPSECYETMGRTIIEAFAVGTPVLASALGPRASMVLPEKTGLHFRPGDVAGLRQQVERCSRDLQIMRSMRTAARAAFEESYTGPVNAELLLDIYRKAIDTARA